VQVCRCRWIIVLIFFVSMDVVWCDVNVSIYFQVERIFQSPQMGSFLLTTQFVHCLTSSSWWWVNSSHFGLQDEQGETGQARPGNFDPSWNRSTQFQVRARLTWRPLHFDGSDRDGGCFSSRSRSIWSSTVNTLCHLFPVRESFRLLLLDEFDYVWMRR
jgi:hypothetical protein